jgi:uncharacterized RDD family membrane protein YckC
MENQINTPEIPSSDVAGSQIKYGGFWIRFVAYMVDRFIAGILSVIPFVLVMLVTMFVSKDAGKEQAHAIMVVAYVLMIVVYFGYFIFLTHKYGATLGKRWLGLQVTAVGGAKLSLGKIILRETVGKIVSSIIISIGFIIAAFTEKKQALHDFMAGSVVTYKNGQVKNNTTAIVVVAVIIGMFVAIAIIGMLSSVVLVSLNSARQKGSDAAIETNLRAMVPQALIYESNNNSFKGFTPMPVSFPVCSGSPIVNISPDGKNIAFFARLCSEPNTYACITTDGKSLSRVGENQITKVTCN